MPDERRGEKMKLGAFFHPTGNHVGFIGSKKYGSLI